MFSGEMIAILLEVLRSWQVIAVTIAVLLYVFLVRYVARLYYRRPFSMHSSKRKKKKSAAPVPAESTGEESESDVNDDELGLE
jgi:hypothetical protein